MASPDVGRKSVVHKTPARRVRRIALVLIGVIVLAVAVAAYVRVGWDRMEQACGLDSAIPAGAGSDGSLSWSWVPPGFTCEWPASDGGQPIRQTHLWW